MQKTRYILILIIISILNFSFIGIAFPESTVQRIELKHKFKLLLDNGNYVIRTESGSITYYSSDNNPIRHFSKESIFKRTPDRKVFIIFRDKIYPLGNYVDIVKNDIYE